MIVKYPVHVYGQHSAVELAKNMAKSHGFKNFIVISVERKAETDWLVTLDATK